MVDDYGHTFVFTINSDSQLKSTDLDTRLPLLNAIGRVKNTQRPISDLK